MPDNTVNTRIKLASKSASDWSTANPTLLSGEVGLDTTNKLIYVGDGSTAFNSLTAWNVLPTNYVTTNTDQNITGTKTFLGTKKVAFKQSGSSDKLGFTLYNNGGTEKGYLEYNPTNLIDGYPLMTLGNYATANGGITQVGFRRYSGVSGANGAYNLLTPLIADAKTPFSLTTTYTNFYMPLGFTNGTATVKTAKSGMVDLSTLLPSFTQEQANWTETDNTKVDYIKNKPTLSTVATSGSYTDLTDKPTIPDAQVQSDWGQADSSEVDYIKNKPSLSAVATSGLYSDLTGTPTLSTVATSGSYTDLINTPTIPTALADLSSDSTHRVVTDTEKSTWDNKSDFSGSYNDLTDKPTIPSAQVQSDWSQSDNTQVDFIKNKPTLSTVATSGDYDDLTNKPTIPPAQVQSDWSQSDNTQVDYIKNKPTLSTVATSGSYTDLSNTPMEIPTISSGDAGKALFVNSLETGVEWDTVGGSSLPTINTGDAGKVLAVNSNEDGVEWSDDLLELSSSVDILDNSVQSGLSSISSDLSAYKDTANSQIAQNSDAIDSVSTSVTSLDNKYDGITQDIQSDLDTLANGDVATNTAFRLVTERIAYSGILWYEGNNPVTGTAVGNLSYTTVNGTKVLDRTGNYVTFTDSNNSISMWSGTDRIAYTENGKWNFSGSEGQTQTFGRYIVEDNQTDGFVIKWGG